MDSLVSLKITLNSGTRRLNISKQTSFEAFEDQIRGLYEVQSAIDWKYIDEENDEVTFSSNQEWADAIQNWPSDKILRIFGTPRQVQPQTQPQSAPQYSQQRGSCCSAFPTRFVVLSALLYSVFSSPLLTLIGIISTLVVTYHHFPATYSNLMSHGTRHWRKLSFAFGLRLLFSCSCCTLLFVAPVAFILYRKAKRCSLNGCNVGQAVWYWLYTLKTRVQQFKDAHKINNGEDVCKFACNLVQGRTCTKSAPQQQPESNVVPTKQPSAPEFNDIYPQINTQETAEPFVLPQRVETSQFENELSALQIMGFDNKKLNEHLLRNFNGDLDRVINSLLQLSAMK